MTSNYIKLISTLISYHLLNVRDNTKMSKANPALNNFQPNEGHKYKQ